MKKAASKKAASPAPSIASEQDKPKLSKSGVTGKAARPFRLEGVFVGTGETVEMTAEQNRRYGHFLEQ